MEKPKNITIDILAGMMNRSFEALGTEVHEIKENISEINNRLDFIEQKVSFGNENRMTRLEDDVRKIKSKLDL